MITIACGGSYEVTFSIVFSFESFKVENRNKFFILIIQLEFTTEPFKVLIYLTFLIYEMDGLLSDV